MLKELPQSSIAPFIRSLTIHVSLYASNDNDSDSQPLLERLFECLLGSLPLGVPSCPHLKELNILLLGREKVLEYIPLAENVRNIDPKIPNEYFAAIARCLSISRLQQLDTLSLDLSTICDLSLILDTGEDTQRLEGTSFFTQNISQLRHLSLTTNTSICAGCSHNHSEYHHRFPASFARSWVCVPYPFLQLLSYGLHNLESLTIDCTDLQRVYLDMHGILTTFPLTKLRYISLHKVFISFNTLLNMLDSGWGSLESIHISWVTRIPRGKTKTIMQKMESMPALERATIITTKNSIFYDRRKPVEWQILQETFVSCY